ncbi:MAG TPA: L-seryl-tRNA(Sec) selenium transferase, partial [Acidimicrobiales bacterium]
ARRRATTAHIATALLREWAITDSTHESKPPESAIRPPSVDRVARELAQKSDLPQPLLVDAARMAVGRSDSTSPVDEAARVARTIERALLQPVINASGVLLHTNLGRSPLAMDQPAGYSNLELDLQTGRRGDRSSHAARLISRATGAEDALVVNNGAAALLLVIAALGSRGDVIVSRGELIEIGGGFRIPEVLASSGAHLVEVGTTNRTRLSDYASAISPRTALLLKVHPSNYRIVGFTEAVDVRDLAGLSRSVAVESAGFSGRPIPVVMDVGSGLLDADCPWIHGGPPSWLAGEPAVRQVLEDGADVVTFSGDKLLGGPQAGVITGSATLVSACRSHPLARAVRPGSLVLSSLQSVMMSYLRGDASSKLPLWRMATTGLTELRQRAEALGAGEVVDCESVMGGGSLPGRTIPSAGVAFEGDLREKLLATDPPVIARVTEGHTVCDLRTVLPEQDSLLRKALPT